jgi:hypothetical protein
MAERTGLIERWKARSCGRKGNKTSRVLTGRSILELQLDFVLIFCDN